jgi:hypothetical protein
VSLAAALRVAAASPPDIASDTDAEQLGARLANTPHAAAAGGGRGREQLAAQHVADVASDLDRQLRRTTHR